MITTIKRWWNRRKDYRQPLKRGSILVVDDDAEIQMVVGQSLKHLGIDVKLANTVDTAIQLLKGHSFDIAVVDLKLRNDSGLAVYDWIRGHDHTIFVVFMTGNLERLQSCRGFFGVLVKPFDPIHFREMLDICAIPHK